jgi:hypothetical protein
MLMKTLTKIFLFTAVVCLIFSCSKYEGDDINVSLKKGKAESNTVTVPFKARFTGEYLWAGPHPDHPECGVWDPDNGEFWALVINAGEGTATHLGHFTYHFEFCCNWLTGVYPGPGQYASGCFVAANGDLLFIMSAGQVYEGRLEDHPEYVNSYWRDPWIITGGTGRFEGATGSGFTDDYNSDLDPYSHHNWRGTITLVRGRQ